MLNLLYDYIQNSLPCDREFVTNPNLSKKVDINRRFVPFEGNTVVFLLNDETKSRISLFQERLYAATPHMLAEKLDPSTFHMTLHDLENAGMGEVGLQDRMERVACQAKELLNAMRQRNALRMRGTWMFNMVNTSIVLGLAPLDEESERALAEMYQAFEKIHPLGYPLTPHITLAYFCPGSYASQDAAALAGALCPVELEVTLEMKDLVLQYFTDMNHYISCV